MSLLWFIVWSDCGYRSSKCHWYRKMKPLVIHITSSGIIQAGYEIVLDAAHRLLTLTRWDDHEWRAPMHNGPKVPWNPECQLPILIGRVIETPGFIFIPFSATFFFSFDAVLFLFFFFFFSSIATWPLLLSSRSSNSMPILNRPCSLPNTGAWRPAWLWCM